MAYPAFARFNLPPQDTDLPGSGAYSSTRTLTDETSGFGAPLSGQTGSAATISAFATPYATLTGLTGMAQASVGNWLTTSGAASAGNNGTFLIVKFNSATSVDILNASAVSPDANDGAISWTERRAYSLNDDLDFERTDRAGIKGVAFDAAVPTYTRPTATGTNVSANLNNIAGKTTDAVAFIIPHWYPSKTVTAATLFYQLSDAGNLKHADSTDRTGVPCFDAAPFTSNTNATRVRITRSSDDVELVVLSGGDAGKLIYGRTKNGTSTSPNSVDIEFRAVAFGADLSTSVAYTWEAGQPTVVNFAINFNKRLDQMSEDEFIRIDTFGVSSDGDLRKDIDDVQTVLGTADGATQLTLSNTGNYFPFVNLPDGTPSVTEALNTLNAQIGNRDYTSPGDTIVTDGQTITASIQALANAISASSVVKVTEHVSSPIAAFTNHALPSSSYTPSSDGQNMDVVWSKLFRTGNNGTIADGVANGNDYQEVDGTHIKNFTTIPAGTNLIFSIRQ